MKQFSRSSNRAGYAKNNVTTPPHAAPTAQPAKSDAFLSDLELLLRSRYPLIFLQTDERERAASLLGHLADRLKLPLYTWTRTKGLRESFELAASAETLAPVKALAEIERWQRRALYCFTDLGADLEDRVLAAKLGDAARQYAKRDGAILVLGNACEVPEALRTMSATLTLPPPLEGEYRDLVKHIYRDLKTRMHVEVHLTREELDRLVSNLKGLTLMEAEKILTKAMVEDNMLSVADIRRVVEGKKAVIEREGLLEYYPAEATMTELAGLSGLKNWLEKRRAIIKEPERAAAFGLPFPKGILLLGVQGCGKSLCAKAVANDWGLPLLKMDPSKLYNKYIGESERNFARAVSVAEKMAPVALWIDEIEKAFATPGAAGEADGGVSTRVLGIFLTWLQERRGDVFVVATANSAHTLPPELVRKGRFDELFFVDLPNEAAREAIFKIHLAKRGRIPQTFDLPRLVAATAGFSGAEIEGVIVSGLYTAFANGGDLSDALLLDEVRLTRPLSQTMREKVQALRDWAQGRAVRAD